MKTIKIQHEKYGERDDVRDISGGPDGHIIGPHWTKNGAIFLFKDGWREVPEPRLENCTNEVKIGPGAEEGWQYLTVQNASGGYDFIATMHNRHYSLHKADLYALNIPDFTVALRNAGFHALDIETILEVVVEHKHSAIQIHRSEVTEPRWKNVMAEIGIDADTGHITHQGKIIHAGGKYKAVIADLYALDEYALDQLHTIREDGSGGYKDISLREYFAHFRTPAIQIHRHTEGEGQ